METDLSDFFTTKSQAIDFSERLNAVVDKIYTADFDIEKILTEQFGMQKRDIFLKLFRKNNISQTREIQEFLKKIQESIQTIPVVSLTIAFHMTDQTLKKLSEWFAFTLKKQVVFDITVDPLLIAGGVVNFNGKSRDFSVRQTFDEIVRDALTDKAPKVQEQVLHQSAESMNIGR